MVDDADPREDCFGRHQNKTWMEHAVRVATSPPRLRTRRRRRGSARLRGVAGLVLVLFVVTGCGAAGDVVGADGGASPLLMREGVIESAAGRAGTELPDGFSVAEGTTLIGDPIPAGVESLHNGEPVMGEGWTARFTAHGDANAIMRAYLRQAVDLGLEQLPVLEPSVVETKGYHVPGNYFDTCAVARGRTCVVLSLVPHSCSPPGSSNSIWCAVRQESSRIVT